MPLYPYEKASFTAEMSKGNFDVKQIRALERSLLDSVHPCDVLVTGKHSLPYVCMTSIAWQACPL